MRYGYLLCESDGRQVARGAFPGVMTDLPAYVCFCGIIFRMVSGQIDKIGDVFYARYEAITVYLIKG